MKKKKFYKDLVDKKYLKDVTIPFCIGLIIILITEHFIYSGPIIHFMTGVLIGIYLFSILYMIKDAFK